MAPRRTFANRWEVVEPIAEGGQAWVYEVRDLSASWKDRAILKRLKNHNRLSRFEREIKAAKILDHPSIAKLVDYSLEDPAFSVSPLYVGTTLRSIAPVNTLAAIDLFIKICEAIAYAHSKGVVHRDIKPENIICGQDGSVVVLDFGLCYFQDEDRLTETMEQVGSRFYMAPEMEAGRASAVNALADSYSLGKLLYFLLSGRDLHREAFSGENNLANLLGNKQLEYLNQYVFPMSVTSDAASRISVVQLLEQVRLVGQLMREHYYPGREGAKCRFCGIGEYVRNWSLTIRVKDGTLEGPKDFETAVCNHCGNLQWFVPQRS